MIDQARAIQDSRSMLSNNCSYRPKSSVSDPTYFMLYG